MFVLQRTVALLMAAAFVFMFLVPRALQAHNGVLAVIVVAIFLAYVAANAWLFVRTRNRRV